MSTTAQPRPATPFPHRGETAAAGTASGSVTTRASCCLPATAEAAPALRRFARGMARCWQLCPDTEDALSVIVTELVTNSVLHSGSPEVSLYLGIDSATLSIEVRDSGRWRPREAPRQEPLDADALCGRGLTLVGAYASRTRACPSPTGTHVVADVDLASADRWARRHLNRRATPQRRTAALGG